MPKGKKKRGHNKGVYGAKASSTFSQNPATFTPPNHGGDSLAGYIFLCSSQTKPECFRYRVFGLPAAAMEVLTKIKTSTKLFLYDFNVKLLYGVYAAVSDGQLKLEPDAFGGKFPAQVRFEILIDCIPLPESALKHAIKDNYEGYSKFKQEINRGQVDLLMSLFRPIAVRQPLPATHQSPNATSLPFMNKEHHFQRLAPPYTPYSRPARHLLWPQQAAYDTDPLVLNRASYLRYPSPYGGLASSERSYLGGPAQEYVGIGVGAPDSMAQTQQQLCSYPHVGTKVASSSASTDAAYWASIAASSSASAYPPPTHNHRHQEENKAATVVGNGVMLGSNVAVAHPQLQQLQEQLLAMQQLLQQAQAPGVPLQVAAPPAHQVVHQVHEQVMQQPQQQVIQASLPQWQQLQEQALAIQQPHQQPISSDLNANLPPSTTTYWTEVGSVDPYGCGRTGYYNIGEVYNSEIGGQRDVESGVPVVAITPAVQTQPQFQVQPPPQPYPPSRIKPASLAYWSPATYVEPKP